MKGRPLAALIVAKKGEPGDGPGGPEKDEGSATGSKQMDVAHEIMGAIKSGDAEGLMHALTAFCDLHESEYEDEPGGE